MLESSGSVPETWGVASLRPPFAGRSAGPCGPPMATCRSRSGAQGPALRSSRASLQQRPREGLKFNEASCVTCTRVEPGPAAVGWLRVRLSSVRVAAVSDPCKGGAWAAVRDRRADQGRLACRDRLASLEGRRAGRDRPASPEGRRAGRDRPASPEGRQACQARRAGSVVGACRRLRLRLRRSTPEAPGTAQEPPAADTSSTRRHRWSPTWTALEPPRAWRHGERCGVPAPPPQTTVPLVPAAAIIKGGSRVPRETCRIRVTWAGLPCRPRASGLR
jgi:hypothetical protein